MSARGKPFYIDEVSILQNVHKGETLYAPYKTSFPEENTLSVEHGIKGEDFAYNVQAFRTRFYYDYISEVSDLMVVKNPYGTALEEPLQDTPRSLMIYQREGGMLLTASASETVSLYNLSGHLLLQLEISEGESTFIPLPAGYYILHTSHENYKVQVK